MSQPTHMQVTTRCAHCPWVFEGELAEGLAAHREHRASVHDIHVVSRKRKGRSPWSSHTPLADNIAQARKQGAAGWASGDTA